MRRALGTDAWSYQSRRCPTVEMIWGHFLDTGPPSMSSARSVSKLEVCCVSLLNVDDSIKHETLTHCWLNPFKPEFTIVIFIHYKPQIAVTILHLYWMKMIWSGWEIEENCHVLVNQLHGNLHSKTPSYWKIKSVFRDVKWCFNASWRLKGLLLTTLLKLYIDPLLTWD